MTISLLAFRVRFMKFCERSVIGSWCVGFLSRGQWGTCTGCIPPLAKRHPSSPHRRPRASVTGVGADRSHALFGRVRQRRHPLPTSRRQHLQPGSGESPQQPPVQRPFVSAVPVAVRVSVVVAREAQPGQPLERPGADVRGGSCRLFTCWLGRRRCYLLLSPILRHRSTTCRCIPEPAGPKRSIRPRPQDAALLHGEEAEQQVQGLLGRGGGLGGGARQPHGGLRRAPVLHAAHQQLR
jgi:hypothetical protein